MQERLVLGRETAEQQFADHERVHQCLAARDPWLRNESGFLAAQEPEPYACVDQYGQRGCGAERRRATGSRSGCEPKASPSLRRRSALINSCRPSSSTAVFVLPRWIAIASRTRSSSRFIVVFMQTLCTTRPYQAIHLCFTFRQVGMVCGRAMVHCHGRLSRLSCSDGRVALSILVHTVSYLDTDEQRKRDVAR